MQLSHLLPFSLLLIPLIWGLYGYIITRGRTENIHYRNEKFNSRALVINSAVLYALAFNLVFFIQELFLALGKRWLGLDAWLYHNNHNWEGYHPMEGLAQGYGASAIFILGIICLLVARRLRVSSHWSQLFMLWMAFQGFAQSLPQFITASVAPDTDTGQAFAYLRINNAVGVLISIASIILMLMTSMAYSSYLLRLAPSMHFTGTASARFGYIWKIALAASLIGVLMIIPFRIMPWNRAAAPLFVTLAAVPMIFANAWNVRTRYVVNNEVNGRILAWPIALLVILLIIFQLVLSRGVAV